MLFQHLFDIFMTLIFEKRRITFNLYFSKSKLQKKAKFPFALSLSKGEKSSWFDKLTTNGNSL